MIRTASGSVPWWSGRRSRPESRPRSDRRARRPTGVPRPARRRRRGRAAGRPRPGLARARGRPAHRQGRHRAGVAAPHRPVPDLHRHRRPAVAEPRRLPVEGRRPRRPAVHADLRRARRDATDQARRATSSASPGGGCPRSSGRACASPTSSTAPACRREATALRFHSFDGAYTESLTLAQARRNDVIVAYQLEGSPLSDEHGGPVRLYVAPMYGYKSCKWLDHIELTKHVEEGYWEERGYDVDGWVGRSNGRDDVPPERRMTIAEERAARSAARRDRPKPEPPLLRFDRVERTLHWVNATLFGMLMLTGAALYAGPISALVGNREMVRTIHVYSGIAAPGPVAARGPRAPRHAPAHRPRAPQPLVPRRRPVVPQAPTRAAWCSASSTRARSSTPRSSPAPPSSCSAPDRS